MNVLHIDEQSGWRGGEQQASYLIRGLATRGHRVVLAGRKDAPFLAADHGAPDAIRIGAPFRGELDIMTARTLARAVRTYAIDILHAHTSHAHTLACIARSWAGRGKVVVSRRVDFLPRNTMINRRKYHWPDHYVAISGRIAAILREYGIPESKVTLVHSGIDPKRLDVAPLDRAGINVPDDAFLFGNVAALVGHKDQATLLHAMALVLKECPHAFLVIAGEGPLRAELESLAQSLGIASRVRFLGYIDYAPALLRSLDAFVMSSKEEGLGTTILDAMAAGVPIAATAAGGIPEAILDGKTGLLAPPEDPPALADAMRRLVQSAQLRESLPPAAHAYLINHFTADAMVTGNLDVYEKLVLT